MMMNATIEKHILTQHIKNIPYKAENTKEKIKALFKIEKFANSHCNGRSNGIGIRILPIIHHRSNNIHDLKKIPKNYSYIPYDYPECKCLKLYCDECLGKKMDYLLRQMTFIDAVMYLELHKDNKFKEFDIEV